MSDWSASENAEMVFVNLFDKTNSLETDEISTNSNLKRFYIPTDQELNDETNFDGDVKDIANEERLEIELRFQQDISNFAENLFDKNKYPNLWQTLRLKKLKVSWIALNDDKSVTVSLPSEKNYAGGLDDMDNDGRVCEIPADTNKNKTNIEKGKWFSGINPGKNSLDSLIEKICEDCDINIGKRHIVNHSMKTTDIIQLTKLGVPFNEIIMVYGGCCLLAGLTGIKADVESCNEDVDDYASSTDCDINIGKRHIVNHSMKTTDIIQLTKLGVPFNEIIMVYGGCCLLAGLTGIKADVESCNEDVDDYASSTGKKKFF
ncbi:4351_t:CDS:2 [Entrophospora sp. SA101]|nr:4351_t:CDS:2 [Entrophospora sp. SA101]